MSEILSWYDVVLQTGIGISHSEARQGWPADMFIWRVAQLQRKEHATRLALHYALSDAANDGSLPSVKKLLRVELSGKNRDIHGNTHGREYEIPRVRDVNEAYVTAADVVAWLERAGEAPSPYIAAWHKHTSADGEWVQLIAERNRADRFLWEERHALVIRAEEARRKAQPGSKGVRAAMAAEMAAGGKPITQQKLFEAMRAHLPVAGRSKNNQTPS